MIEEGGCNRVPPSIAPLEAHVSFTQTTPQANFRRGRFVEDLRVSANNVLADEG